MDTTIEAINVQDDELVKRSLAGDRRASACLVERHQAAVCAVTFAHCGDVHQSEDLAQETFLQAWKHLGDLKEPSRLRSWLCGIARNISRNARRKQARVSEPAALGDDLREGSVPSPPDAAITREEQAILWKNLERLPEEYREPMVLFYRNQESVAAVAMALGISEEAARQRLSRGRAMLAQRMEAIVHDGLRRSGPSAAFTIAVLAAIPGMTTANVATLGAAIAKGAGSAKGAVTLGSVVSVLLGPILGILGTYFGYRLGVAQTIAAEERRFIRRYLLTVWLAAAGLMLLLLGLGMCGRALGLSAGARAGIIIAAALLYSLMLLLSCFRYERRIREIRALVVAGRPEMQRAATAMSQRWNIRYRSAWSLLGVPLVEVNMGGTADARPAVAKGWIAIGAKAYGLLFACGAIAIAPLSFGGLAIGVLTWGGFALGVYVWGGFAIGLGALGGVAVGIKAVGGCALGWSAAWGAVAVAHNFAQGAVAAAAHVNDEVAREFFDHDLFFRGARLFLVYSNWVWLLILVPILPILLRVRRNMRQATLKSE